MVPLSHTDRDKSEKVQTIYLNIFEVRKNIKRKQDIRESCPLTGKLLTEGGVSRKKKKSKWK